MGPSQRKKKSYSKSKEHSIQHCELPPIPARVLAADLHPHRASLIRYIEKKWLNFTVLHYCFLDQPSQWRGRNNQKEVVIAAFQKWKDLDIGLEFREVQEPAEAEIRIGFEPGGSWSYVGRDGLQYAPDPSERTMNFGWDLTTPYGHDTALHEIGHALGFPHEHQNPNSGIVWNEPAVYSYFRGSPNFWNDQQIIWNILRKIDAAEVGGSAWDQDSIMHYQFNAGLIDIPESFRDNPLLPAPGLSQVDIEEVRRFYPPRETTPEIPELIPYRSHAFRIEPGAQIDFVIKPRYSRRYTIQTFGPLDTVMVLFVERNGTPRFVKGDDDSGTNLNTRLRVRLIRNYTYYLRLRLYFSFSAGEAALMMW